GHSYVVNRKTDEKILWRCNKYQIFKCRARIHTSDGMIVKRLQEHNHAGNQAKVEATGAINKIKNMAVNSQESSQQIIASVMSELSPAVVGQMPSTSCIKRTIRHSRNIYDCSPPNPTHLSQLEIPLEYRFTHKLELFLIFDNPEAGNDRMLIFATQKNLLLLARAKTDVIPAVFALLHRKNEETYTKLLQELKRHQGQLNPERIMTDFEIAAINGFHTVFPQSQQRGCFFHFCQCIYREIQSNGLKYEYENNAEFALKLRMLSALAFVPTDQIVTSFEALCDSNILPPSAQPVIDYVEDNWIGRPDRRAVRRDPRYAHALWNCYEDTGENLPKTNNSCEGWHRSFSSLVSSNHPTLWKFIDKLKDEQGRNEAVIEQYVAGEDLPPRKKKYRDAAERLRRVVSDY
uniref:MULE transposase domain-containing protein n=1 Tax=Ciona intestinalis TaxID=7719 RepID=H2XZ20_CIOIN